MTPETLSTEIRIGAAANTDTHAPTPSTPDTDAGHAATGGIPVLVAFRLRRSVAQQALDTSCGAGTCPKSNRRRRRRSIGTLTAGNWGLNGNDSDDSQRKRRRNRCSQESAYNAPLRSLDGRDNAERYSTSTPPANARRKDTITWVDSQRQLGLIVSGHQRFNLE